MKLSKSEIKLLTPQKEQFRRALRSDWCTPLSRSEEELFLSIVRKDQPDYSYNRTCGTCILNLVKLVARYWNNSVPKDDQV